MSKKTNLIYQITKTLKLKRAGSHATKNTYRITMKSIVKDLYHLHSAPSSWNLLTEEQIRKLVQYWQSKAIKTTTICNRLGVLRNFLLLNHIPIDFPSNKDLGLTIKKIKKIQRKTAGNATILTLFDKLQHPVVKTIAEFELSFGLTKSEAIRLSLYFVDQEKISLYRDAASNNKDRHIPIITDQQKACIQNRIKTLSIYGAAHSLTELLSFGQLCALYQIDFILGKIENAHALRQYYANSRFKMLKEKLSEKEALKIVQAEMGLSSNRLIRAWIHE